MLLQAALHLWPLRPSLLRPVLLRQLACSFSHAGSTGWSWGHVLQSCYSTSSSSSSSAGAGAGGADEQQKPGQQLHPGQQAAKQADPQQQPVDPHQQQQQQQQPDAHAGAGQQQAQQQQQQQQQEPQQGQEQQQQPEQQVEGPGGLLEEWRVNSAAWYDKYMATVVQLHLSTPQLSTWSRFYHTTRPGLLTSLFFPGGCSHITYTLRWMYADHATVAGFLLQEAHADFGDLDTFRAGVTQALSYTTSLYAGSEWAELKPLVSAGLLDSMKLMGGLQRRLAEGTGVRVEDVELEVDPDTVQLACAHALTRQQLAAIDEGRAREQLPLVPVGAEDEETGTVDPGASAAAGAACAASAAPVAEGAADAVVWDAVHVYAEGTLHVSVRAGGGGGTHRLSIPKSGHWVLARGPLHLDRVVPAGSNPWFLLGWL